MKAEQCGAYSLDLPLREPVIAPDVQRVMTCYQKKMASYLLEMSRLDGLEALADDHRLPHRFLTYMCKVMELYDESKRFFANYWRREGLRIQCRPGCAHCCRNMPAGVTLVELIYFYHGMHQSGAFSRLFRRCLEAEESLEQFRMLCRGDASLIPVQPLADGDAEKILWLYQARGESCRFLQANLCQLYQFRPLACRMHFSLTPAYWCDPQHFQFPHAEIINMEPGACVYEALDRVERRLGIKISGVLACGLLELTINVMHFDCIRWSN